MERLKEVAESIRISRKCAGLTQTELANKTGISQTAISYWENGVHIPNVSDLWRIADVLQISIDELVGRI